MFNYTHSPNDVCLFKQIARLNQRPEPSVASCLLALLSNYPKTVCNSRKIQDLRAFSELLRPETDPEIVGSLTHCP